MRKADKTLKSVLSLIDVDVKIIKKSWRHQQLPEEVALTLTRYASTLKNIIEQDEKEDEKKKQQYKKLTTAEIAELVLQERGKKK